MVEASVTVWLLSQPYPSEGSKRSQDASHSSLGQRDKVEEGDISLAQREGESKSLPTLRREDGKVNLKRVCVTVDTRVERVTRDNMQHGLVWS